MFILKHIPTCFGHHSDHLQGARMFLEFYTPTNALLYTIKY